MEILSELIDMNTFLHGRPPPVARIEWNKENASMTATFFQATYTGERKHFLCMREDFCRKARKD